MQKIDLSASANLSPFGHKLYHMYIPCSSILSLGEKASLPSGTNIILLKVEDWSWWRLPVHMAERWQQTRFNDIFPLSYLAVEGRH